MKRNALRALPLLLAAVLLLAGCSTTPAPSSQASTPPAPSPAAPAGSGAPAASSAAPQYAPAAFNVMIRGTPEIFGVPRTAEIHGKTAKERWNIDLKYEMVDKNTYNDKVTAKFAAGDFPSILYYGEAKVIQNAIESKVFLPVTKAVMDPVYDSVNRDLYFCRWKIGDEYYGFNYHSGTCEPIVLRADWLKNLNLEVPKNAEELRKVLLAFTTGDPDKNGKPDTYGWSLQGDLGFTGQIWGMLLGTPRLQVTKGAGLYIDISDNTIKSALQDAASMKTALQWFSDCYRDGSIDPQYVTLKQQDVESKFVSGQCGIWVKEIGALQTRLEQMLPNFPDAAIVAMPPVSIKQGVTNYDYVAYKSDPYFMTKAVPDVERGYELLKYLFGKEGTYAEAYGEEGVEYKIEGGKFIWLDEAAHVRSNPARVVSSYLKLPLLDPIPLISDSMERVKDANELGAEPGTYATITQSYKDSSADIDKVALEGITQIIVGEKPVDYYDQVLAELQKLGLDKVAADVNATFQSAK